MDIQTLRELQKMPLHQKVAHTLDKASAFIYALKEQGREPYISFSGGKDSTVLLDIIRRFIDPDHKISAVYCNTGNEWPENVRFVRSIPGVEVIYPKLKMPAVLEKYGFPLISKEQAKAIHEVRHTNRESVRNRRLYGVENYKSGKIFNRWQFLVNTPFAVSHKCCDCLKKRPFAIYESQTNKAPILGTMAEESDNRQGQYLRRGGCNALTGKRLASHAMSVWMDCDIWEYKRLYNIPFSRMYEIPGVHQTGCMVCGFGAQRPEDNRLEVLYTTQPKAYNIFMDYTNNGITYREALRAIGVVLPDEYRQLKLFV